MDIRHQFMLLPAVLTIVLTLSACGGGSDGSEVASLANDATSSSTSSPTASGDLEKEVLAYVECLRAQGANVPDPTVDADGNLTFAPPAGGGDGGATLDRDKIAKAQEVCGDPPAGLTSSFSEEDRSAFEDAALKFAKCMRDEGVDVPDPDFSQGLGAGAGAFDDLDQDDPKVAAAMEVCQKVFADAGIRQPGGSS